MSVQFCLSRVYEGSTLELPRWANLGPFMLNFECPAMCLPLLGIDNAIPNPPSGGKHNEETQDTGRAMFVLVVYVEGLLKVPLWLEVVECYGKVLA